MNSSTIRRLAADHSALHNSPLPPYYLFPPSSGIPDDLTQLTILLAGPNGTPYTKGLWKLHLKIPEDYPKSPPKAAFRTRIWHPNVEEVSGSVCVDTLKRDWEAKLTLRDVLITISCLLIHPNPDSALNSTAGHLLQEDYSAFARQATLMTSIHARISPDLAAAVEAAKQRGEDPSSTTSDNPQRPANRKTASTSTVTTKTSAHLALSHGASSTRSISAPTPPHRAPAEEDSDSDSGANNDENAENDPSLSPSPVTIPTLSPRRPSLHKRPLSDLPTPPEPDDNDDDNEAPPGGMSPSEQNIAANAAVLAAQNEIKLAERNRSVNALGNSWQQDTFATSVDGDGDDDRPKKRICSADGKENGLGLWPANLARPPAGVGVVRQTAVTARKIKARAGLRRL